MTKFTTLITLIIVIFGSCKTKQPLTKDLLNKYRVRDETLHKSEVYISKELVLKYDTIYSKRDSYKKTGIISSKREHEEVIIVKSRAKGIINSVERKKDKLFLGVLFEKGADPIYFMMNRRGHLELYQEYETKTFYGEQEFSIERGPNSRELPQLLIKVDKKIKRTKNKTILDGY